MRWRAALAAALLLAGRPAGAQDALLPSSTLSFRDARGGWRELWSSDAAPVVARGRVLADAMPWRTGASGVEWGEMQLKGSGEAWRTRLVVARMDPALVQLVKGWKNDKAWWTLLRGDVTAAVKVNGSLASLRAR